MHPGPLDRPLLRRPGVAVEELDGQLLLLLPGATDVVHLDQVASLVWDLLEEPHTRVELAARVAQAYGVEQARVEDDLVPLLTLLHEQGLVDAADGA